MANLIAPFPGCCGAHVLYGFYGTPDSPYDYDYTNPRSKNYGKPKATWAQGVDREIGHLTGQGKKDTLILAVLNKSQMEVSKGVWPEFLKSRGFEFVMQWNNSNHGQSHCYLFAFVANNSSSKVEDTKAIPAQWEKIQVASKPSETKVASAGIAA